MALSAYFAVRGKKGESFIHSFIHSDKSRFNTECVFNIERVAKQKRWHVASWEETCSVRTRRGPVSAEEVYPGGLWREQDWGRLKQQRRNF